MASDWTQISARLLPNDEVLDNYLACLCLHFLTNEMGRIALAGGVSWLGHPPIGEKLQGGSLVWVRVGGNQSELFSRIDVCLSPFLSL